GETGLEDCLLVVADGPRRPLRLLVHRAVDGEGRVGHGAVVVAADHAVLVDRQLEDVVGVLLLALDHGEDAQRLPLLLLVGFRLLPRGGVGGRLGGVVRGRGDRLAIVVNVVALVDDGGAVVVVDGRRGVAAEGGVGGVRPVRPVGGRRRPPRVAPRGRVGRIPARVEIVVAPEPGANVPGLRPYRRAAAVGGVVAHRA